MGSSSNLISAKKQQEKSFNNAKQEKLDQLFNYGFHQQQKGYISQIIVKHINSWETYQIESKEMNQFYKDLERDHSYIQWLFPNFFKSNFNFDSYSLTIIERNEMVNDKKVMDFYLKNYKMTLRFFGIKWGIEMLEFENSKQFNKCININTHNQLRLKRILCFRITRRSFKIIRIYISTK